MATFDYSRIAARADTIVARFGRADAKLRRSNDAREGRWDSKITTTDYDCTAAVVDYADSAIDGTEIIAGDRMALVAPGSLDVVPAFDDRFVWAGEVYRVVKPVRVAPAGTVVLWILQLRR